jgi:hypothetical protein
MPGLIMLPDIKTGIILLKKGSPKRAAFFIFFQEIDPSLLSHSDIMAFLHANFRFQKEIIPALDSKYGHQKMFRT